MSLPETLPTNIFAEILATMPQNPTLVDSAYGSFKEFKKRSDIGLTELLTNPNTTLEQVLVVTESAVKQKAPRDLTKPDFGDPVDYVIRTDGACIGNPGPMGIGIAVFSNNGESFEKGYSLFIDEAQGTNQKAELLAGIAGLWIGLGLVKAGKSLRFECDSEYFVKTLNGDYGIGDPDNARLFMMAAYLRAQYPTAPAFHHIYREWNQEADYLSNEALGFPETQLIARLGDFQTALANLPDFEPNNLLLRSTVPLLRRQLEKQGIPEATFDTVLRNLFDHANVAKPKQGTRIPAA